MLLPFIFDRFRQGSGERRGGLGIGLSLVRHLVELHGGEVVARSDGPGTGATFIVKLPLTIARPVETSGVHPGVSMGARQPDGQPLQGLHVLATDDDADSLELLHAVLTEHGAHVTVTTSMKEGLSDVEMPGGDGYSFVHAVRAHPDGSVRTVPMVAVTAYGRVEDRIRLLSAGFNMHLPKPVDPSELVAVIVSLTRRPEQAR
jgi:CheY-like chemotaxis protein